METAGAGCSGMGSGPPLGQLRAWGTDVDSGAACTLRVCAHAEDGQGEATLVVHTDVLLELHGGQAAPGRIHRTATLEPPTLCPCARPRLSEPQCVHPQNGAKREDTGRPPPPCEHRGAATRGPCRWRVLPWGGAGSSPQPQDRVAVAEGCRPLGGTAGPVGGGRMPTVRPVSLGQVPCAPRGRLEGTWGSCLPAGTMDGAAIGLGLTCHPGH